MLSHVLVVNSKDTVFWMHETVQIGMEPAVRLTGVRKGNQIIWTRGLVLRAEHEGVALSRSWLATVERMGIEVRYGSAALALLQVGRRTCENNARKLFQVNRVFWFAVRG